MVQSPGKKWVLQICVLATLTLQGCGTGSSVGTVGPPKLFPLAVKSDPLCDGQDPRRPLTGGCTPELLDSLAFAELGQLSIFNMKGSGTCDEVSFDFGDGTPPNISSNVTFAQGQGWQVRHTYNGWPGKKIVRVKGVTNCLADSSTQISVGFEPEGREELRNAFRPNSSQCNEVMFTASPPRAMPPIRKGSVLRIETDGAVINYGGANLDFNASGDPSTPTPPGYLFPAYRKFSLVYRIGSQSVQGEAGPVTFRATQTAPLEICVNDNPSYLADNTGGMLVTITVNESSAEQ